MKTYLAKFVSKKTFNNIYYLYPISHLERCFVLFLRTINRELFRLLRIFRSISVRICFLILRKVRQYYGLLSPRRWSNFDFRFVDFQTTAKLVKLMDKSDSAQQFEGQNRDHIKSEGTRNWVFNGTIVGATDCFNVAQDIILFSRHPLWRIKIPDAVNGNVKIASDKNQALLAYRLWGRRWKKKNNIMSLVGTGTQNYCHWLVDHLPKLLIANELLPNCSIIVDDMMPNQHYESLDLIKRPEQEVRILRAGEFLKSDNVFIFPNCSSTIAHPSDEHKLGDCDTYFDPTLLKSLVASLEQKLPETDVTMPSRVFFDRGISSSRRIVNHEDVSSLLARYDFIRVNPMTLSFTEQVLLVKSAELIVSQNGGATANLIFCKPGTQFIGITNKHISTNIGYFSALAMAMQVDFTQLFSKAVFSPLTHPAHFDLEVNLEDLEKTLVEKIKSLKVE